MGGALLNTIEIDDPADPRVAPYMNLKDAHLALLGGEEPADRRAGLFLAEGSLVVRAAIRSRYEVESVLALRARAMAMAEDLAKLPESTPVYVAGREVVERIVGFDLHRGILAACRRGRGLSVEALLAQSRGLVVLEDLANHDNVGGIYRSVAALWGDGAGVLLSPRCCDPLYRKAIRVSTGHVLSVATARSTDWTGDLARVSQAGFELVALSTDGGAVDIERFRPSGRVALVLGAEGSGLSRRALEEGARVRIPMQPGVDSLNVVVACAIALHRLESGFRGI